MSQHAKAQHLLNLAANVGCDVSVSSTGAASFEISGDIPSYNGDLCMLSPPNTRDVYIIAGQSNAMGHGIPTGTFTNPVGMTLADGTLITETNVNTLYTTDVYGDGNGPIQTFGVERYIADCLPPAVNAPVVIKGAYGGVPIRGYLANTNPGRWQQLLADIQAFKATSTINDVFHFIWVHGDGDINATHSPLYEAKEKELFDAVIAELPDVRIYNVLSQRGSNPTTIGYRDVINAGKINNGIHYPRYKTLRTIPPGVAGWDVGGGGYDTWGDRKHYSNTGLAQFAQEFCSVKF